MPNKVVSRKKNKPSRRERARSQDREANFDATAALRQVTDLRKNGQVIRAREGARRLFRMDSETYRDLFLDLSIEAIELEITEQKYETALLWFLEAPKHDWLESERARRCWAITHLFAEAEKDRQTAAGICCELEGLPDPVKSRAADLLVVSKDARAEVVQKGIAALGRKDWTGLGEQLRLIPRQSLFAPWRLFLAGCAAWYQGRAEEAGKLLTRLDAKSLPGKKARAILALTGHSDLKELATKRELSHFLRHPNLFESLEKADEALARDSLRQAHGILAALNGFPSYKPNHFGVVTHAFVTRMTDEAIESDDSMYAKALESLVKKDLPASQGMFNSQMVIRGAGQDLAQLESDPMGREVFAAVWYKFRDSFEKLYFKSPRFLAMCVLYRVRFLIEDDYPSDYPEIVRGLQEAIKCDPDYETAYLELLSYYEDNDALAPARKLRDEMVKRFPDSPQIVLSAAEENLDRGNYSKALRYFQKAEESAPLNRRIRLGIFDCHLAIAFEKAAKVDAAGVSTNLKKATAYAVAKSDPADQSFLNHISFFGTIVDEFSKFLNLKDAPHNYTPLSPPMDMWVRCLVDENITQTAKTTKSKTAVSRVDQIPKGRLSGAEVFQVLGTLYSPSKVLKFSKAIENWTINMAENSIREFEDTDLPWLQRLGHLVMCLDKLDGEIDLLGTIADRIKKISPDSLYFKLASARADHPSPFDALDLLEELDQRSREVQGDPKLGEMVRRIKPYLEHLGRMARYLERPRPPRPPKKGASRAKKKKPVETNELQPELNLFD